MKVGKFYRNREERCISGGTGCGVVYLSGCDMRCAYCLVYGISQGGNGVTYTPRQLAELLLSLQQRGVSHISLANVEPSADEVIEAIAIARKLGLTVPLCNNFNGYAPAALTERLLPYFQAYIMDFKYADDALGQRLSAVPAYPPMPGPIWPCFPPAMAPTAMMRSAFCKAVCCCGILSYRGNGRILRTPSACWQSTTPAAILCPSSRTSSRRAIPPPCCLRPIPSPRNACAALQILPIRWAFPSCNFRGFGR